MQYTWCWFKTTHDDVSNNQLDWFNLRGAIYTPDMGLEPGALSVLMCLCLFKATLSKVVELKEKRELSGSFLTTASTNN